MSDADSSDAVVERADAIAAGGIVGDIEIFAELDCGFTVDYFFQRFSVELTHLGVKEAWTDGAVGFDNGRHPGCVTDG